MKFLIAALLLVFGASNAATIQGRVVGVSDGDTITVLDADKVSYKIRLSGIDAPEKNQPFGLRSKKSLSDLIYGQTVSVHSTKRDKYRRYVAKVLIGALDVNLHQIAMGMAWHYTAYAFEQTPADRELYSQAQNTAKARNLGLWSGHSPVPPWRFRSGN